MGLVPTDAIMIGENLFYTVFILLQDSQRKSHDNAMSCIRIRVDSISMVLVMQIALVVMSVLGNMDAE